MPMGRLCTVEGEMIGFLAGRHGLINRCRLRTATGEIVLKFPKEWAPRLQSTIVPGDRVQARGKLKLDDDSGTEVLKAEVLLHLRPTQDAASQDAASLAEVPAAVASEACPGVAVEEPATAVAVKSRVLVCRGSDCRKRGACALVRALEEAVDRYGLGEQVEIETTGCLKRCKQAPNMVILPQKARLSRVSPAEAGEALLTHLLPKLE